MKLKKYFIVAITILLALCLVGCGEANTEKAVANSIEKNTAKLDGIIQKLDEINYDDIIIQDISPFSSEQTSTVNNLERTKYYSVGRGESKKYPSSALLTNKSKENAKFVSTDKIDIPENRNSLKNNSYKSYSTNRVNNYTPRYVNETSNNFSRNGLDNYLSQIEIVYNTCADCIGCSAECKNETAKIKQNINQCKVLSSKLKDGTIKLNESEIDSCNDCLNNLQACSYKLNLTKDNIAIKEKDVTKLKDNLSKNLSQLQEAYSKLLTALESRLDYLKNCNDCIASLCDVINKTNVNMQEAEKNKSDKEDIDLTEDKLKNEQENTKTYEDGILDSKQNLTPTKSLSNTSKNKNYVAKNTSTNSKNETNKYSKNQANPYKKIVEDRNVKRSSNQTQNKPNNTTKNENFGKKYRDNLIRTPYVNDSNNNAENMQNYQSKIDSNKNTENQNQQNFNTAQNNANRSNQNIPNVNNNGNFNNVPVNPYQNGYNYGYGNMPYPPRNIDTYRTIIKNIDTYSPNYVPGNGINANRNQSFNNSQTTTNENTETYNNDNQEVLQNETNDNNLQNEKDNSELKNEQNFVEQSKNNTTMQNSVQNSKKLENTDQNTTMQNQNLENKTKISPENDVSEVKEIVNELY